MEELNVGTAGRVPSIAFAKSTAKIPMHKRIENEKCSRIFAMAMRDGAEDVNEIWRQTTEIQKSYE